MEDILKAFEDDGMSKRNFSRLMLKILNINKPTLISKNIKREMNNHIMIITIKWWEEESNIHTTCI